MAYPPDAYKITILCISRQRLSAAYKTGAILDEIQRTPDLFSYIQPMVDSDPTPGRFILTGSQQFNVRDALTQSLAGRTGLLTLFLGRGTC